MTLKIRILVKYIVLLTFEFKALPKYNDLLVWFNSLSSENTDVYILVIFCGLKPLASLQYTKTSVEEYKF